MSIACRNPCTLNNSTLLYASCVRVPLVKIFKLSCLGWSAMWLKSHVCCVAKGPCWHKKTAFLFCHFLLQWVSSVCLCWNPTPVYNQPIYLQRFPSFSFSAPPPPPHRAAVGQPSLVVSSLDFLEPLREAGALASDIISVKDIEPWHCLVHGWGPTAEPTSFLHTATTHMQNVDIKCAQRLKILIPRSYSPFFLGKMSQTLTKKKIPNQVISLFAKQATSHL